jgi:GR25 family glycosyltransferase involved in LPS biosynthesis
MFLDYFDKVVVVNLDTRPDRLTRFVNRIELLGETIGKTIERFSAVDGKTIPVDQINNRSAGAAGCKKSHLDIIADCRKNKVKSVLILEDDVTFVKGFAHTFEPFMKDLPED